MIVSLLRPLLLGLFVVIGCLPKATANIPFQELSLEEAQQMAYQKDKLFFLYFTADWCMPCRWMEQETFQDPDLANYVKANYLAIKVDISKAEGRILQEQFEVSIIPTVLVFDALGHLVDRREASQEAPSLLRWLKRLDKPANHLDPRLHTIALSGALAMDSPQAEVHFSRPALVPDASEAAPLLSQTNDAAPAEMLMVYNEPNSSTVFTPRSAQRYCVQLAGPSYDYSDGIRMIAEMERKHQQRAELHPLSDGRFRVLIGDFETTGKAKIFLNYLLRNNQQGEIIPLENQ